MSMTEPTRILVLRHGSVEGVSHIFRGQKEDPPLDTNGKKQMRNLLDGRQFDRVASSPLQRCQAPALQIAAENKRSLELLPAMMEMDFGIWDGHSVDEVSKRWPMEYQTFRSYTDAAQPPQGESLGHFRSRIQTAWADWVEKANGGCWLLVTHAGVMRILLQQILGLPNSAVYQIALPQAAHFEVSHLADHPPVLLSLNACITS